MWTIDDNSIKKYLQICDDACKDAKIFSNFRRHIDYSSIVTGQTFEQGLQYLQKLKVKKSFLLLENNVEKVKKGDNIGNPIKFNYEILGEISPTLIRYSNVLHELVENFGSLQDFSIVEIGGGYGGQCNMIKDFFEIKDYQIIDVPQALNLVNKCLSTFDYNAVELTSYDSLQNSRDKEIDLLISNYAISELNKDIQDIYIENIIKKSKRGYITYNCLKKDTNRNKPYSDSEFKDILKSLNYKVFSYNENVKKSECEVILWK